MCIEQVSFCPEDIGICSPWSFASVVSSQHTMLSYAWPLTTIINQHTLTHATTLSNRLITITATTTTNTLHTLRAARRHTAIIQEPTWTRYTSQHPRSTIKLEIGSHHQHAILPNNPAQYTIHSRHQPRHWHWPNTTCFPWPPLELFWLIVACAALCFYMSIYHHLHDARLNLWKSGAQTLCCFRHRHHTSWKTFAPIINTIAVTKTLASHMIPDHHHSKFNQHNN